MNSHDQNSEVQPELVGGPINATPEQAPHNPGAGGSVPPAVEHAPANEAASGAARGAAEPAPSHQVAGIPRLPTVELIPFNQIVADMKANSFRDDEELSDASLLGLREALSAAKITTPLLVKALGNGKFGLLDGHRRCECVKTNIELKIDGFWENMEVPCQVLPKETSDLEAMKIAISANIQRLQFSALGRIRAAMYLRQKGMSTKDIGTLIGKSPTTVLRDLALGDDEEFMEHVRKHETHDRIRIPSFRWQRRRGGIKTK